MATAQWSEEKFNETIFVEFSRELQQAKALSDEEICYELEIRGLNPDPSNRKNTEELMRCFSKENGDASIWPALPSQIGNEEEVQYLKDEIIRIGELTEVELEQREGSLRRTELRQRCIHMYWRWFRMKSTVRKESHTANLKTLYSCFTKLAPSTNTLRNEEEQIHIVRPNSTVNMSSDSHESMNNGLNPDAEAFNSISLLNSSETNNNGSRNHRNSNNLNNDGIPIDQQQVNTQINLEMLRIIQELQRQQVRTVPRTDHANGLYKARILFTATSEGSTLEVYFGKLDYYVRVNRLSYSTIMDVVHTTLKDNPSEWYWNVFEKQADKSYADFKKGLNKRFGDQLNKTQMIIKASEVKYINGNMLAHIDKVLKILAKGSIEEKDQVEIILHGFSEEVQRHLDSEKITSTSELTERVRKLYPSNCTTEIPNKKVEPKEYFKSKSVAQITSELDNNQADNNENTADNQEQPSEAEVFAMFKRFMNSNDRFKTRDSQKKNTAGIDRKKKCYNCGSDRHYFQECLTPRTKIFCFRCGRVGSKFPECQTEACANRRIELTKN